MSRPSLTAVATALLLGLSVATRAAVAAPCAPDLTPASVPAVDPQPDDPLVSHTEVFTVAIPAEAFNAQLARAPLERLLPGTARIAAVTGTRALTPAPFGQPGAPRVVCLSDGGTAVEEAVENAPGRVFRYRVWNYTVDVARPIAYGLGRFELRALDATHAEVTWTYSFKLRDDRFPGRLGTLGRWLFRRQFMEGDYAGMMKVSAEAMSRYFVAVR